MSYEHLPDCGPGGFTAASGPEFPATFAERDVPRRQLLGFFTTSRLTALGAAGSAAASRHLSRLPSRRFPSTEVPSAPFLVGNPWAEFAAGCS